MHTRTVRAGRVSVAVWRGSGRRGTPSKGNREDLSLGRDDLNARRMMEALASRDGEDARAVRMSLPC